MTEHTQVLAPFSGERAVNGPLTWGQHAIWRSIVEFAPHSSWQNINRIVAVPKRRTLSAEQVADAVAALMTRHESLRTRIVTTDGQLLQETAKAGQLPISVIETLPGEADRTAQQTSDRLGAISFDYANDWPLRAAVVVVDGAATHLVVTFSHLAVDFYAAELLARELRLLLLRGAITAPAGWQSMDLALRQRGVDARSDERARDYWTGQYERLPGSMFTQASAAAEPWHRGALLISPAINAAARIIAVRHGVTTSTVLLAATAALVSAWGGHDVCGLVTMSNNRYQTGHADAVAKLNQLGLVVLDVADRPDFDELVPRAWNSALQAYQHSYYHPLEMNQALQGVVRARGDNLEPDCYFDDLRLPGADEPIGSASTESAVHACLDQSTLTWTDRPLKPMRAGLPLVSANGFTWRFRLRVLDAPGTLALALALSLEIDTRYLSPKQAELFLEEFEALLVTAAFHRVRWPYSGR